MHFVKELRVYLESSPPPPCDYDELRFLREEMLSSNFCMISSVHRVTWDRKYLKQHKNLVPSSYLCINQPPQAQVSSYLESRNTLNIDHLLGINDTPASITYI